MASIRFVLLIVFQCALATYVDPISDLGYIGIERSGNAAPKEEVWGISPPRQTNAYWVNLALSTAEGTMSNTFVTPYAAVPRVGGLDVAYPWTFTVNGKIFQQAFDEMHPVQLRYVEAGMSQRGLHKIIDEDDFSVTLKYSQSKNAGSGLTIPLVQGSPYITAIYEGVTPLIRGVGTGTGKVVVDNETIDCSTTTTVKGSRVEFTVFTTDSLWIAYFSRPIKLSLDCGQGASAVKLQGLETATEPLFVRLALANNCSTGYNPQHCEEIRARDNQDYIELLDKHASTVVLGGKTSWSVLGDSTSITYEWKTQSFENNDVPALMLALPFHLSSLTEGVVNYAGTHRLIFGRAIPVIGNKWVLSFPLGEIGFTPTLYPDSSKVDDILDALNQDADFLPPDNFQYGASDPYFAGKMLQRMAINAIIAEDLGEIVTAKKIAKALDPFVRVWLEHRTANPLLYDKSWGGIISCGCSYDHGKCTNSGPPGGCPALSDAGMDFGNAFFNDHHFHYGYLIYSAAVLTHFDPSWPNQLANVTHSSSHKTTLHDLVMALIRDIANPAEDDPFFPRFRHKDWYMGYSWASGIIAFYNGRNQESTSEAVNAWYGITMYGLATANKQLEDMGKALLVTEVLGAQTYWHIRENSDIFPEELWSRRCIGILWSLMAQYATWFGGEDYHIHGIQMLPFTPASELLLEKEWVDQEISVFKESCDGHSDCKGKGWESVMVMGLAVSDPDTAWTRAKSLPDSLYDPEDASGNGNSRTSTLYWVATRTKGAKERK